MGLSLEPFQRAGLVDVTLDDLERLVMDAAEQLLPEQPAVDARSELSAAEVEFLERAGVNPSDFAPPDQGAASALVRTAAGYAVLLAASAPPSAIAERIGVDESRVRQRINQHTLYAVRDGRGWRVPLFQLDASGHALLPGLERIVPHLYDAHLVEVARWFLSPQVDLEGPDEVPMSPRDWLLSGHDPRVAEMVTQEFDGLG
jgi:hypothetical protein